MKSDGVRCRGDREQGRVAPPGLDGVDGPRGGADQVGKGLLGDARALAGTPDARSNALDVIHYYALLRKYIADLAVTGSQLSPFTGNLQDTSERDVVLPVPQHLAHEAEICFRLARTRLSDRAVAPSARTSSNGLK